MVEKYAKNGVFISVENEPRLFNSLTTYACNMAPAFPRSSRYGIALQCEKPAQSNASPFKVRIAANSKSAVLEFIKVVRNYHCVHNHIEPTLAQTNNTDTCSPLRVTGMSVDDYYTSCNHEAIDYQSMHGLVKVVDKDLTYMAEELNAEESELSTRV